MNFYIRSSMQSPQTLHGDVTMQRLILSYLRCKYVFLYDRDLTILFS